MSRFLFCSTRVSPPLQPFLLLSPSSLKNKNPDPNFFRTTKPYTTLLTKNPNPITNASGSESSSITTDENDDAPCVSSCKNSSSGDQLPETSFGDGVEIKIEKPGKNSRKITARIRISAGLETIWKILTDYERLADFLPGLASSELLERGGNWVRLFQIGQQNLGFGLKFNAKAIVDCFEKDLEYLPFGLRRDIEFRLVEGDFQTFDGIWSIIQVDGNTQNDQLLEINETILLYTLDVEPKLWLPVGFVEGIICKEIDVNLQCIRERAQRMLLESHRRTTTWTQHLHLKTLKTSLETYITQSIRSHFCRDIGRSTSTFTTYSEISCSYYSFPFRIYFRILL